MKKRLRIIALILAHLGVLLSIVYLGFFLVIRAKAANVDRTESVSETDLYLSRALSDRDFSVISVGRALSDDSDSSKENLFMALDLVIPVLFLSTGVILQIAVTRTRRKAIHQPTHIQPSNTRREL
jgi:hypothetical protein